VRRRTPIHQSIRARILAVLILTSLVASCGGDAVPTPTPTTPPVIGSPTPTVPPVPPTPVPADTRIEGGDPTMGLDIQDAGHVGGTLIEGWATDLQSVNPVLVNDSPSAAFTQMIFEPLIEIHPATLEPVGVLAEAWLVSGDGLSWTFFLRGDIKWHDGEPFTAHDVKFTYDLHLDPDSNSSYTGDLSAKIASIEVVDDLTVRFHLPNPFADFAVDVAVYLIIPEHIWENIPAAEVVSDPGSTGVDVDRVIGTGPFRFVTWLPGERATVARYDDYWGGRPHLDEYIFKVIPDQSSGIAQLQTGEIDWLGGIPGSAVNELAGSEDIALRDFATLGFSFYGTNLDPEKTTLFQDVRVRRALLHALDREAMVDTIRFGYGTVAVGTMPTLSWAYNPAAIEQTYRYDVELARQLLDEAGWVQASDGIRVKDGQRFSFTMLADVGDPIASAYVTAMQEFWNEIGIAMQPDLLPFQSLVEAVAVTFDFDAFLIGFSWGPSPDQGAMFECGAYQAGFNVVRYCNEEIDELLAEARAEQDQDRRLELYTEFQNLIMADLPIAVLDFPRSISGINTRVHNVFPSTINERFNAETWWVEE
jgi:peptide/nickel transport system substrate-binding protein